MNHVKEFIIKRSDIRMYRSKYGQFSTSSWLVSYSFMFKGDKHQSPFYTIYPEISIKDQIISHINNLMHYTGNENSIKILVQND